MPLLSKRAQEEGKKSSSSGVDRYLNPGKLEDGSSVRFSLLEENALDFYEVWGSLTEDSSKSRPYRFTDDPTPEDIEEAMVFLEKNHTVETIGPFSTHYGMIESFEEETKSFICNINFIFLFYSIPE